MTSLLQKINELDLRIDNISTSGGGGTTDTTALQNQIDINTTDILTLQTDKMNTLIPGDNINITGNVISTTSNITLTDGYLYESAKLLVIYHSTNTILGSSTTMYIPFDSTRVINTTFFERLGNTVVVVKVAGKYKFDVTVNWDNSISSNPKTVWTRLMVNDVLNTDAASLVYMLNNNTARYATSVFSYALDLNLNDQIKVHCILRTDSGGFSSSFTNIVMRNNTAMVVEHLGT
jgi:hypothetical protein